MWKSARVILLPERSCARWEPETSLIICLCARYVTRHWFSVFGAQGASLSGVYELSGRGTRESKTLSSTGLCVIVGHYRDWYCRALLALRA